MPQAEALDELLKHKHIKLDAVIELRVNESALLNRVETRVAQMRERGEEVRLDDTPEVLAKRLASYRNHDGTADPLLFGAAEALTVDGMMAIDEVTREIHRILAAIGAVEPKADARPSARKAAKAAAKKAKRPRAKKPSQTPKRPPKPPTRPRKGLKRRARRPSRGSREGERQPKRPRRLPKRVPKSRKKGHEKAS